MVIQYKISDVKTNFFFKDGNVLTIYSKSTPPTQLQIGIIIAK